MLYTPRSKYYLREELFRAMYGTTARIKIEYHAHNWQATHEPDVIDKCLLGFPAGMGKPTNTQRIWIVARSLNQ